MENLPIYISILFVVITLVSIGWLYYASNQSKKVIGVLIFWFLVQTVLGMAGFYEDSSTFPPNIVKFGILPVVIFIATLFLTQKGRAYIDGLNLERVTYMHSMRIFVEIILALLFHQGVISVLQTFEGANFDILSGLTAPIVAYLAYTKGSIGKRGLLIWNVLCLILLTTIIVISTLALDSPIQQLAFDQPNLAILYYPFNMLPTIVVPIMFFGHLVAIRRNL